MKLEDLAKTTDADLASERTTSNIDILKTELEVFIARGKAELKKLNAAEKKEVTDFIRSLKNDEEVQNAAEFIHSIVDREIERERLAKRLEIIEKKYNEYFAN